MSQSTTTSSISSMAQEKTEQAKQFTRESFGKMKTFFGDQKKKWDQRVTMEGVLKQARESFEYFLQSGAIQIEKTISDKLMRDAYGVVFLTEVKGGLLFGGVKAGTGLLMTRVEGQENEWSAPIAIGTGGVSAGLLAGVSKVDHIIILPSPNHVKAFIGKGQLSMKLNFQGAVAKYGRDANAGIGVSDQGDAAPVMSYSFGVKGLYAGVTADGAVLVPRNACNEEFYGKKVDLKDIVNGTIEAPKLNQDYQQIVKLLNGKLGADNVEYKPPQMNDPVDHHWTEVTGGNDE